MTRILVILTRTFVMACQKMTRAAKRYLARLLPAMTLYVLVLAGADWLFHHHPPSGWLRYALAVAPAIPVIGAIAAMGLYLVEEADEFQRTVMTQAMLLAVGFTLATTTVWGFLETYAGVAHLPGYLVFGIFAAALGPAGPLVRWRYR
ncbi:hypothetical protein C5708_16310 [Caulobacter sp. CCUG 60055]|nr:hypothetical protein [Caulobacter sp. CCUG 60055]